MVMAPAALMLRSATRRFWAESAAIDARLLDWPDSEVVEAAVGMAPLESAINFRCLRES
jgi:hypothetical protein